MAIVEIVVNSKTYQIVCDAQDSIKLKEYAELLDSRINEIKNQSPDLFLGLNNETLLIFSALSFIEDFLELKNKCADTTQLDNLYKIVSQIKKNLDKAQKNMLE